MDEELRAYLVAMEGRLVGRMNDQHERLLEGITALRNDYQSTKTFLVEDALVNGRRLRSFEDRLERVEKHLGI